MIAIREASVDDADGIARVHVETWKTAYRGIVPDEYLDALDVNLRTQRWRDGLANPEGPTWVGALDGEILGWANAVSSRDPDASKQVGELYGVYVDPAWWGRGVAQLLMDQACSWLRDRFTIATLWTLEANARARRFYERNGWSFDKTHKADDSRGFVLSQVRYRINLT